jgi:transposase-like protein
MAERNIDVDHVTIWRWIQCYAPELGRRELRITNGSWRVDKTYLRVAGKWTPHLLSTCKAKETRLMRQARGFAPATPVFIALRPTLSSREGAQSAPRLSATPVALRSHPCVALSSPES